MNTFKTIFRPTRDNHQVRYYSAVLYSVYLTKGSTKQSNRIQLDKLANTTLILTSNLF